MACNRHTALLKKIGSRDSNRHLYGTVTAALFPAVRMQTTSVSTNRWKDKPNTVHMYNGLVLSRGKE